MLPNKKKNRPHTQVETDGSSLPRIFSSSLKGAALGLAASVLLALLMCTIAYNSPDPDKLIFPLSLAALYVPAFLAGLIATRTNGGSSLICGLVSGGVFMLVYMFVSLFFPAELSARYGFGISFLLHALIILFSVLGGYAGQKRTQKSHRPKR